MPGRLEAVRVLVTGGTSGIGEAIVERLMEDGARVVFTGRDDVRGAAVADRTEATFLRADAAHEDQVNHSVDRAVGLLGGLDALICNAGVISEGTISQTSLQDWQTLLDVNLTAPYLYSIRAIPALREAGGGSIVHVSSDAGVWGEEEIGAYSVSKAALITLTQMLAMDAGPSGIRVNAVCPGDTLPGMVTTTAGREEYGDTGGWRTPPMNRIGTGEDVAGVVSFLLSPDSSFVNGTAILIDGGMRASYRAWEAAT
jgi:meso-butanediol dehydrogenase/(S,S)-butanediol dehydrogenase/diacetyl reductase